jgi:hypothetical protein
MADARSFDPVGLLTLREVRAFIRDASAGGGVVFFGLLYVLGSLFLGGMIVLGDVRGGYTLTILWSGTAGSWNYPGLLLVAPWGVVSLPFFATVSMVVVGVGVGLGMTVAFVLAIRLIRNRTVGSARTSATGAVAGLTPAMISLVTLGACCSTTAAATAGVGLVAQASGTSATNLLLNNWYLGVFQIVMVWVALLAQEMLLVVYAGLFGRSVGLAGTETTVPRSLTDRRFWAVGAVRVALLSAGIVWALTVLAEWTTVNPLSAGAGEWFQWIVQHWVVAGVAVGTALFPASVGAGLLRSRRGVGWVLPILIAVGGLSLILWVPPPLPSLGVDGLLNQVFGAAGAPAGWGGIAPGAVSGPALFLRWAFEYGLLGGFATSAALVPARVFDWFAGALPLSGPGISSHSGTVAPAPRGLVPGDHATMSSSLPEAP